jgi:hypothetical protein
MKAKIYITQRSNDKYFAQKLPTFRNGFCYIERKVTFISDPDGVYDEGEYGYINVQGQKVIVIASCDSFEIL